MAIYFRRIGYFISILLVTLAQAGRVAAQNESATVAVKGWDGAANPSAITVYDATGRKLGVKDLSGVNILGQRRWLAGFDLVEVASGQLVQKRYLKTVMCEVSLADARVAEPKVKVAAPGRGEHNRALSAGSGADCPD